MTCLQKRRFSSKSEAKLFARRVRSYGNKKCRPYHCESCNRWHLTTVGAEARAYFRQRTKETA